jgi:transglutaminase-like putative cysteine protease
VKFEVTHVTQYEYSESVSVSHHVAHLTPRTLPNQVREGHQLQIEPAPDVTTTHVDYFGNPMTFFALQSAHRTLTVRALSTVVVSATVPPSPSETPPWERAADRTFLPYDALDYVFDSIALRTSADLAAYARSSFPAGRPLLEALADLTSRIHQDFTFDPKATTVATPLARVFESRRGVCQDFARLEIACLHALGLAARYVSGYLETVPRPGQPRVVGADASHAWLAVCCPEFGWIDVDPTNNCFPSERHLTLAWGRDFDDVSPIRGVVLGGGEHSLRVSVDVVRLEVK